VEESEKGETGGVGRGMPPTSEILNMSLNEGSGRRREKGRGVEKGN